MRVIRAVIADDQKLARDRVRDLLKEADDIECVGEAATGEATIEVVDRLRPDLLFLDVRMPAGSGIDVAASLSHRPLIVFTTAYDQFAVAAFELRALDYLLKPFGKQRVGATLERAREVMMDRRRLEQVETPGGSKGSDKALRRIFVRSGGWITPVSVDEVEHFEAQRDYVTLRTGDREYLIRSTMASLESQLDDTTFVRIHRSHIVNLDHVVRLVRHDDDRLAVQMKSGATIVASRRGSRKLRTDAR